jgi:two-component system nitrogen regulation sensor histidine kinase NtrY
MTYATNRWTIVLRVIVLIGLIAGLAWCLFETSYVVVPFLLFASVVIATRDLIRYVDKTNREFADFLTAIKNSDFSRLNTSDKRGPSFTRLREAQNKIVDEFQRIRIEREAHYFFLQNVVEHIKTAIIALDHQGGIVLMNGSARQLLDVPYLKNISALKASHPDLHDTITNLPPGNQPWFELERPEGKLRMSLRASHFSINGNRHKLISLTNIESELDFTELQAWEKLIHVLTHEIMNSMTPISSLSSLLRTKAAGLAGKQGDDVNDIAEGLQVIEKRSYGLMNFVNNYKTLTAIPKPDLKTVAVEAVFKRIKVLRQEVLVAQGVQLVLVLKSNDLFIHADPDLLEQILLNLVNNSADACGGVPQPVIELSAQASDHKVIISVTDNGSGIDRSHLDKIFIPFFTTKKTGSGIGLSLSKQIMRLHRGNLLVSSAPGKTEFQLEFPASIPL